MMGRYSIAHRCLTKANDKVSQLINFNNTLSEKYSIMKRVQA
jgi:hypothetical protein